jgi:tRNA pseudouridine38-40 synthase
VHATLQVVHFDAGVTRPDTAWVRGVNSHLPSDVAVLWARPVAGEFHARYAATARHYTYLLANRPVRPALLAGRAGWYHRKLDLAAMTEAAGALIGTHDFSAFRAAECQAKSPSRTMAALSIAAMGDFVRFEFSANAFLHHMIRNIVGALVYVGVGKHPPSWIGELLAGRDRTRAAPTFAPDGLYFTGADFDAKWRLPPTRRPLALPLAR